VIELMNMNPDYLSDNGLKLLSVIADHAALAIENARLLAETRQRSEEQALLLSQWPSSPQTWPWKPCWMRSAANG